MNKIAVIGVGNLLMGDEGVGIHAINYLRNFTWPNNIYLIDAGVPGTSLIHLLERYDRAIIIDCADFNGTPGELLYVNIDCLKKPDEKMISLHGTSLLGTLSLAEKLDIKMPPIDLICIQPESIEMRDRLSSKLTEALPKIKSEIERAI